jgi:hypothetical protein
VADHTPPRSLSANGSSAESPALPVVVSGVIQQIQGTTGKKYCYDAFYYNTPCGNWTGNGYSNAIWVAPPGYTGGITGVSHLESPGPTTLSGGCQAVRRSRRAAVGSRRAVRQVVQTIVTTRSCRSRMTSGLSSVPASWQRSHVRMALNLGLVSWNALVIMRYLLRSLRV